jgi:antitoxin VapB
MPESSPSEAQSPQTKGLTRKHAAIYLLDISLEVSVDKAKVFWSGRSQAVRLPKEYRFECQEVRIRRQGNGIFLEPVNSDWSWLDAAVRELASDYMADGREQPAPQERPELDGLFS